jgi:UDP-N-acetylglucosamine 2-epimerase (non-hydrolysing)
MGLEPGHYVVVTLHRAGTVDDVRRLAGLLESLSTLGREIPVIFPVHPRTRARMRAANLEARAADACRLIDPMGYLEMLGLVDGAALVITDSGGLQAECGFLGVPCVTARLTTEWAVTVEHGLNRLVPPEGPLVLDAAREALHSGRKPEAFIEGWDGCAAQRIVEQLVAIPADDP